MPKRAASSTLEAPARRSSRFHANPIKDESSSDPELASPVPRTKASKRVIEEKTKRKKATTKSASDLAAQKLKKLTSFVASPYPSFKHPTPTECRRVVEVLSELHGPAVRPTGKPIDDTSPGASCGAVPSILDALIRTILSQNTTSKNSSAAKSNLDATFGKGNWSAMATASHDALEDSIRIAGLAPSKSTTIQTVLHTTYDTYGTYSLDHLHHASNDAAMAELISFKGVGPKTASCVLLFCMARDSFAVDTHIFRLSKSLGWVPKTAGREETYGHLDIMIPAEFKYPLHTLLITHGKRCARCSAHRKSGLLDADKCPLIGLSKSKIEQEDVKEEQKEDVVTGPKVPDSLKKQVDDLKQEQD